MLKDLLLMRLLLLNAMGAAALAAAWHYGFVQMLFAGDKSYISYGIAALFVLGLLSVFQRAVKVSMSLNKLRGTDPVERIRTGRSMARDGDKFLAKQAHIASIANWCAALGLLGTCVGLAQMVSGIDIEQLTTLDGVQGAIGPLITGWGTALFTTIAGAIASLWLELNDRMLQTASVSLIADAQHA